MKLKVFLLIAQGFLRRKSVTNTKRIFPDTTWNGKWFKQQHILVHDNLVVFEFLFSFSSDRATMHSTGTFKLAIV